MSELVPLKRRYSKSVSKSKRIYRLVVPVTAKERAQYRYVARRAHKSMAAFTRAQLNLACETLPEALR